jgi:hypothetical protein
MTKNCLSSVGLLLALAFFGRVETAASSGSFIEAGALTDRSSVDAFLRAHAGESYEDASLGDFRVLDLDQDGRLDLIATIDSSGRRFFNHLLVLHDNGKRLTVQEIDVWNMESLSEAVADLDGDGRPEILLRQSLTPYLGARPNSSWTAVYGFDGQKLSDHSAMFPKFYEDRILPNLKRDLAVKKDGEPDDLYQSEVLTIERDQILRKVGLVSDAGLTSALNWARSEDPTIRIFAAAVLGDIGGPEADAALQLLMEDRDPEVAIHARVAHIMSKSGKAP